MCNRYGTPSPQALSSHFQVAAPSAPYRPYLGPLNDGIYIADGQAKVGQWGLIPDRSKTKAPLRSDGKRLSTNNCRSEGMASSWTFKRPWEKGQRCLIPAADFDEPYWGSPTGKNIWWRFRRADATPWALAGLYNDWIDPATGEVVHSYTMLTINADDHPIMRLMHKPDPRFAPDKQDKRGVISIEEADWQQWLEGSADEARQLLRVPAQELIDQGPADTTVDERLLV